MRPDSISPHRSTRFPARWFIVGICATVLLSLVPVIAASGPAAATVDWTWMTTSPIGTWNGGTPSVVSATATFGPAAGVYGTAYGPAGYFMTDGRDDTGTTPQAPSWIRFSFSKPVTSVRISYLWVEFNDPEAFATSDGPIDFRPKAAGGAVVDSGGDLVAGQPEATYAGNVVRCASRNTCSAWVELSFDEPITFVQAWSYESGGPTAGINLTSVSLPSPEDQTVVFPDQSTTFSDTAWIPTIPATTTGDGPISYSVDDAGSAGCTVDRLTGAITSTAAGTCRITATAGATVGYRAGSTTATITIAPATQTVTFPDQGTLDASPWTPGVLATTDGDGAITYSVADSGTAGCSVDPATGTITFTAVGTCDITATAAATATHASGSTTATMTMNPGVQIVVFWDQSTIFTSSPWTPVLATTDGDGAITYSVADSGTAGCSVDPATGTITFTAVGTCDITATAAATSSFATASTTVTMTVEKAPQTVTFADRSTSGSGPYQFGSATSDGDGTIEYEVLDPGSTGCEIDRTTGEVTYAAAGSCVVEARAVGTAHFLTGLAVATLTISKQEPTIEFSAQTTLFTPEPWGPEQPATTSGDGTIDYTVLDPGTAGCTMDPVIGMIRFTSPGTCVLGATSSETALFTSASTSAQVTVNDPVVPAFTG